MKKIIYCFYSLIILFSCFNVYSEEPQDSEYAESLEICTQHLVEIGKALQAYQKDHSDLPTWLSDLCPEYLEDEKLLVCPADASSGVSAPPQVKDPKLPVSYFYEFNPSMREWKAEQLQVYSDITPIVRCMYHSKGEEPIILNLSFAFEVYQTGGTWEKSPRVLESLLASIKKNVLAAPAEGKSNIMLDSVYSLAGNYIEELDAFIGEIIENQPENGSAYKVLGALRLMNNNEKEAIAAFEKALSLLPKDAETYCVAGALYDQQQQTDKAIASFEAAFKLQPEDVRFFWYYPALANLYIQTGRNTDADALVDRIKSVMNPDRPQDQVILGDMLMELKRYQEALQVYEELSKQYPNEKYILGKLAEVHQAMGNIDRAKEYWRKVDPAMAMVGEVIPDFSDTDTDGKPVSLKDYRGKVLLLDFWAAWCGPCKTEMPNVKKVYEKHHSSGFEIVGISLDTDEAKFRAFIKDNGVTWRQIFSGKGWNSPLAQKYGIRSIPAPWLIDKEGRLISTQARGSNLEQMVAEALKK